jgi:hypothetical protein
MSMAIRYAQGCPYGISRYASSYIHTTLYIRRDKSRRTISIILSNAAIYADDKNLESPMHAIM